MTVEPWRGELHVLYLVQLIQAPTYTSAKHKHLLLIQVCSCTTSSLRANAFFMSLPCRNSMWATQVSNTSAYF